MLNDAGITLKLKKCKLFTGRIKYLGHVNKPGKLDIPDHTANAIGDLEIHRTITRLQSFVGL